MAGGRVRDNTGDNNVTALWLMIRPTIVNGLQKYDNENGLLINQRAHMA